MIGRGFSANLLRYISTYRILSPAFLFAVLIIPLFNFASSHDLLLCMFFFFFLFFACHQQKHLIFNIASVFIMITLFQGSYYGSRLTFVVTTAHKCKKEVVELFYIRHKDSHGLYVTSLFAWLLSLIHI